MSFRLSIATLLAAAALSARGATYYVATTGSDSNAGTSNAPFATPQYAVTLSALAAGDTIYVRGGNYALNAAVKPSKAGTASNYFKLWAFPGEKPVFDFAGLATGAKALDTRKDYWHVRGIEVKNAPDSGIFVGGFGVIIEGCATHDCGNDGLILGSSSTRATNALILNCDSYRNYAGGDGNNGDGFAAKVGNGPGNIFRGCRSWNNSDDAWDFYDNNTSVTLDGCWAFSNGYDLWNYGTGWSGNGNGFKLGGEGTSAEHLLTNCVAFGNRSKGFDHNNGDAGQTMVNCTSYGNGAANFSFYETPSKGTRLFNLLINCASYGGGSLTNLAPNTVMVSNSWQLVSVNAADFASLDTSMATNARNADYSLPTMPLFRLSSSSQLIDKGVNVGLPFNGTKPDLGAFEYAATASAPAFIATNCVKVAGGFQLNLGGFTAHGPVIVYASSNLASWLPIYTNAATSGSVQFTDSVAGPTRRYYRALEQ